jgi:phosphoribosylaminoimidazolecarboxamide formyltransferase / IMP cyclohydrolase
MANDLRRITRALISVSDKTGLVEFAQALAKRQIEIISTGGTGSVLAHAHIAVTDIADLTGFPEMMDGRLKSLHPKVHGGLLAIRENPEHEAAMLAHNIAPIDLLVVNLYPFEQRVAEGASLEDCVENIDVGGPAMIRAAAKNHTDVTVVTEAADYPAILDELMQHQGATSLDLRRKLAQKAFARTAAYDAAISNWMAAVIDDPTPLYRTVGGRRRATMRYGENPHQTAALYATPEPRFGVTGARQLQGRKLSFNNISDTDAALECVAEFHPTDSAAVAIIKHANPSGVAAAAALPEAYAKALRCDPVSAYGGIVAVNRRLDEAAAAEIIKIFTEVIIAPDADPAAIARIAGKKDLRLLLSGGLPDPRAPGIKVQTVAGGLLVQSRDTGVIDDLTLTTVSDRRPTANELTDLQFAFRVAKHVKSNAIVIAKDRATIGIGAGQMSRVDSVRIAVWKAAEAAQISGDSPALSCSGAVAASDAFFPFADGIVALAKAGVTAVIEPGGSIRDPEIIRTANEHGLALVFTGTRHFRH